MRRWLRGLLVLGAFMYALSLLMLWIGLGWIGERWWVTSAGLYVPRILFAAPLPFIVLLLCVFGLRRLLWTQLAAAFILVVPLLGFVVPLPSGSNADAPGLRVLSFNANFGYAGQQAIADTILAQSADVVLLQECPNCADLAGMLQKRYPVVQRSTQFMIASRYPVSATTEPARLPFNGQMRSPRYIRYVLDTPLGRIAFYSVHPISPRGVFQLQRFRFAFHQLRTGQMFAGDPESDMTDNAGLRGLQIAAVARDAAREQLPVIIAGDTNLPGLSLVFREHLSRYQDGFRAASWGFGYTFPDRFPFLRLDRILAGDSLRFTSFRTGCKGISDHLCVVADIQAR
jgi:endonuclease/exonuclease/phosphatase (EEP) superfamily protein YafD